MEPIDLWDAMAAEEVGPSWEDVKSNQFDRNVVKLEPVSQSEA